LASTREENGKQSLTKTGTTVSTTWKQNIGHPRRRWGELDHPKANELDYIGQDLQPLTYNVRYYTHINTRIE
jgi:hypothetical protein